MVPPSGNLRVWELTPEQRIKVPGTLRPMARRGSTRVRSGRTGTSLMNGSLFLRQTTLSDPDLEKDRDGGGGRDLPDVNPRADAVAACAASALTGTFMRCIS